MDDLKRVLKSYWAYDDFRELQDRIVLSIAQSKDTLGLMPTGGGKSLCFQVPAMLMDGVCIVVTPLVALMKDQVYNLNQKNISAELIHSGLEKDEINKIFDKCIYGKVKFLYISPERIATSLFREKIEHINLNIIAIDESHCISQWGYDFRPSYLKIIELRELKPHTPILALTASATLDVVEDIQEKLGFREKNVFRKSFERKNLVYIVRYIEDKTSYLVKILKTQKGSSVVYVRNRRKSKEISDYLNENGIKADYYHAGLANNLKDYKQEQWKLGRTQAIVATNAFGMGIDKPDVRTVVHMEVPDSLEAYYQEAGRAGRDEKTAFAVMLYSKSDRKKIEQRIDVNFPSKQTIKSVAVAMYNFLQVAVGAGRDAIFDFSLSDFCKRNKFQIQIAYNSLKILERCGYIVYNDESEHKSKIQIIIPKDSLYDYKFDDLGLELFLKQLLRNYSGLFTKMISLDPDYLANRLQLDKNKINSYLKQLSQRKIIKYIPSRVKAQIILSQERIPNSYLTINREAYDNRKERYLGKINAILNYCESRNLCRSKMLLDYFGQKKSPNCNYCDTCRDYLNDNDNKSLEQKILSKLSNQNVLLSDLISKVNHSKKDIVNCIRELNDEDKVEIIENMYIRLK
ncbi:MAG: RecQ family ATP-dependent DNA helicase [Marinifilaceae bacterium]|nr:RecQ family ATP-dependent DNA helicase [Marinifilaceae bacterium]